MCGCTVSCAPLVYDAFSLLVWFDALEPDEMQRRSRSKSPVVAVRHRREAIVRFIIGGRRPGRLRDKGGRMSLSWAAWKRL